MFVVAGPPGSGKSTMFPVAKFGCQYFNADDRAAELNGGSYIDIPMGIRRRVNREFEEFVLGCIDSRLNFALETTLRSNVTFEQAELAKAAGFRVEIRYLALRNFEMHLKRVKARADAGGHSASEPTLRRIYDASVGNLERAVSVADELWAYDNSDSHTPELVAQAREGKLTFLSPAPPRWLSDALGLG
jgi:predicted ABC-type ATPase